MIFWAFALIGLGIISLEVVASRRNKITRAMEKTSMKWCTAHRFRWLIGLPFAVVSVFAIYPMSGYQFIGFPFIAGAFAKNGADFIGPFTLVALIANAVTWYFLPSILLWAWQRPGKVTEVVNV